MKDSSASPAGDAARRLFTRHLEGRTDADMVAAAASLCERMSDGLSGWFGQYGSHALLGRALARVQSEHPSLASVTARSGRSPYLAGLTESTHIHGAEKTAAGVVAVFEALANTLARLMGDDLAVRLLEQSAAPRASASPHFTGHAP